jgi:hypothetical protein
VILREAESVHRSGARRGMAWRPTGIVRVPSADSSGTRRKTPAGNRHCSIGSPLAPFVRRIVLQFPNGSGQLLEPRHPFGNPVARGGHRLRDNRHIGCTRGVRLADRDTRIAP